ncbi:hypothetical protein [Streptomyces liangshanensis]|uniref:MBL fold metallo-hydrolase n=1 Tax=Streptomyces liangshanensis TaxID=2717324 RepID=A0A6G9H6E0_9ACTN|nr:hypothetical protein [Streptomyces liangshanensis]QIQ06060.1 hypothetical protein HA039_30475 [Streptomyces liangshanensis]
MAWQLDIHVLDVGQGQSVLVVASDAAAGAGATRTLLIDGGHQQSAPDIRRGIAAAGVDRVDVMISTNYDVDHLGGLIGLLRADNAWQLADYVAAAAVAAAVPHAASTSDFHVAAAAAAIALLRGVPATDVPRINSIVNLMLLSVPPMANDVVRAGFAMNETEDAINGWISTGMPLGATLARTVQQRLNYAHAVAVTAGQWLALPQAGITAKAAEALTWMLCATAQIPMVSTEGLFRNTRVIDIGNLPAASPWWPLALAGAVETVAGTRVTAPGFVARPYGFPALGTELLWAGGAPANAATAPVAVMVSGRRRAWQGPNPSAAVNADTPSNNASIGVVVRFNNFAFMTCGDLPHDGEDALGAALTTHPLPTAAGGGATAPAPTRIAAYTCGHHGASTATSNPLVPQAFLNSATPVTPIISCGANLYPHPHGQTTARLQAAVSVAAFYLTNCRHARLEVPYSPGPGVPAVPQQGHPQKGRIAGDNGGPGGHAGDISLQVTQAASQAAAGAGQYSVSYWDQALAAPVPGGAPAPGAVTNIVNF